MKYNTAVVIIGPTGTGKTAVAFELARRVGVGEVINLDKMYIFKHFSLSTGLADSLKEKGIKRHLYEFLEPDEDIIPATAYIEMVKNKCAQILSHGGLPIIEGGSTTYGPALLEVNNKNKFCDPVIGLRFPGGTDIKEKFSKRVDTALQEGIIGEVKEGLKKYRDTLMMTEAISIIPIVRYLDGKIDIQEAKEEIVELCLKYHGLQMETFMKYPGITWLEYKSVELSQTVDRIITLIDKKI